MKSKSWSIARAAFGCSSVCLVAFAMTGCTPAVTDTLAPVSGRLTLEGTPLVGAVITFTPQILLAGGGSSSVAVTDADGRFQLELMDTGAPGAYVGLHRVEIRMGAPDAEFVTERPAAEAVSTQADSLPECFNDASSIYLQVHGDRPNNFKMELREIAELLARGSAR